MPHALAWGIVLIALALLLAAPAHPPLFAEEHQGEAGPRRLTVRLTYYVDRGTMRTGYHTFDGAVAVDPRCVPHGSILRIIGDARLRVALDTGGLVRGCHIDVWAPSHQAGQDLLDRFGEYPEIEVIQEP